MTPDPSEKRREFRTVLYISGAANPTSEQVKAGIGRQVTLYTVGTVYGVEYRNDGGDLIRHHFWWPDEAREYFDECVYRSGLPGGLDNED